MGYTSREQIDTVSALRSQLYRYYSTAYYEGVYNNRLDKAIEHDLIPWFLELKKNVEAEGGDLDTMRVSFQYDKPVLKDGVTIVCSYDAMDNATMRKLRLPLTDEKLDRKEVEAKLYKMIKELKSGMSVEQFAEKYRGNDVYHGVADLEQNLLERINNVTGTACNAGITNPKDNKAFTAIVANISSDLAVAKFISQNSFARVGYDNGKITAGKDVVDKYSMIIRCQKDKPSVSVKKAPLKVIGYEVNLRYTSGCSSCMKLKPTGGTYTQQIEKLLNDRALEKEREERGR